MLGFRLGYKLVFSIVILFTFSLFADSVLFADDLRAYRVFDNEGDEVDFDDIMEKALESDLVLFGEHHTNPICHWLQLEIVKKLHEGKNGNIILGSEIFESDDQVIIDEYMDSLYSYKRFKGEMKLWGNFVTDYKPIFDFAFDNNIKFVATNIPRRYASLVANKGYDALDSLSEEAKSFIAPPPFVIDTALKGYSDMAKMFGPEMSHKANYMMKAQAIKDQTMAHNIILNLEDNKTFFHINGTYHNQNYEGIVWYVKQKLNEIKIASIVTVVQKNVDELEEKNIGMGDFIIVVPDNMTQTNR